MASLKQKIICTRFSLFLVILFGLNSFAYYNNIKVPSIITFDSEEHMIQIDDIVDPVANIPEWIDGNGYYLISIEVMPMIGLLNYGQLDDLVLEFWDMATGQYQMVDDDEGLYGYPRAFIETANMIGNYYIIRVFIE